MNRKGAQLKTLDEVLEQSRLSQEVMEKYVLNKKVMQKTKDDLEGAMLRLRKLSKKSEVKIWQPERYSVSKNMINQMAFLFEVK